MRAMWVGAMPDSWSRRRMGISCGVGEPAGCVPMASTAVNSLGSMSAMEEDERREGVDIHGANVEHAVLNVLHGAACQIRVQLGQLVHVDHWRLGTGEAAWEL